MWPVVEVKNFRPRSTGCHQCLCASLFTGQMVLIAGPNGAGKTTLMRAVLGLTSRWTGTIKVDARRMAYVSQGPVDFPSMPLREVCELQSEFEERRFELVLQALELKGMDNRPMALLSGGEAQRAKVVFALCFHPDLLVLDEPFVGADDRGRRLIAELIINEKSKRLTILSEHAFDQASLVAFDQTLRVGT
jgi:ABC-type multidrug transport system ATPase subunit